MDVSGSGNGDFLVIRATGTDAYNPYIQQLCPGENSVATLIIPNRTAASDPFVIATIQNAEALWIAGGDQSNYINYWQGTPVQQELNGLIARGVPVGGTSAGMNVLGQFVYSAQASQAITSSEASLIRSANTSRWCEISPMSLFSKESSMIPTS
jgi:cyanophycinase-like exopeptidase